MAEEIIGIIGGTGLGDVLIKNVTDIEICDVETPFGKPSDNITIGNFGERKIAFLNRHGKGHKFSPSEVPYAANIFAFKKLGVHTLIASGAVGSLREQIAPGDLVLVDQFVDKTFKRSNTFFDSFGAVHCEMSEPVCGRLGKVLFDVSKKINIKTHPEGTYVCMEGPQFSTRAESLMHRVWGGDVIGMTAMPEAKLAREAQMCYALVALASDYDCWQAHEPGKDKQALLKEIITNLNTATTNCLELIRSVLEIDNELVCEECQCRESLGLAGWTAEDQIDPDYKEKTKLLFE